MWAIGHPGYLEDLPEHLRQRELAPRVRRKLEHTLFGDSLDHPHPIAGGEPIEP
jgi:hypothetical protein